MQAKGVMKVTDEGRQPEAEPDGTPEEPVRVKRRRSGGRSLKRSGDWGDRPELWDPDRVPLRGYLVAAIIILLIVVCLWLLLKGPITTALRPPDAGLGLPTDGAIGGGVRDVKITCPHCGRTFSQGEARVFPGS